ncbi:hypothetical protein T07_12326 [Trichinella nelsoni]|uniref:Uncharacterized protein n=1 Tax=Trichinella nelsoni TaxID=6336 RepID=A0A0V0RMC1_9BILA|nr:hypothetical protein T07_12326 [Trichinella nelsoni]
MFVSLTIANCQQQYCNLNYWENGVREMSNDEIGVNYELAWGVFHPGMVVIRRAVHGESWSRAASGLEVALSTGYLYLHSKRTNKQANKQTIENKFNNTLDGSVRIFDRVCYRSSLSTVTGCFCKTNWSQNNYRTRPP